nr:hypothetical protein GCM10025730_20760 [Promicromonospora thailandica]
MTSRDTAAGRGDQVRWAALFGDLEAQADAQSAAELDALVPELTRAEHATMTLADRFRAVIGSGVTVELLDGEPLRGVVREAADEWVLLQGCGPSRRGGTWCRSAPSPVCRVWLARPRPRRPGAMRSGSAPCCVRSSVTGCGSRCARSGVR